jgi:hypothetical protein
MKQDHEKGLLSNALHASSLLAFTGKVMSRADAVPEM